MSRIVALDLARVGAAAWRDGGSIRTRQFVLAKRTASVEEKTEFLLAWLTELFAEVGPESVSVENDTGRGLGARTLRAYHAVAGIAARRAGASYRQDINAVRARKYGLGYGAGSKDQNVAKARMLFRLAPELTDDEVDAVVLLVATEHLDRADELIAVAERERKMREAAVRRAAKKAERLAAKATTGGPTP